MLIGILGSAALCGLHAYGGLAWMVGFMALLPWLRSMEGTQTLGKALLSGYLMSVAYTLAVFAWFGSAVGSYIEIGEAAGLLLLLLAAPLFQPQIIAFALARHLTARRHGPVLKAFAALDAAGQATLASDLTEVLQRFNRGGSDTLTISSEYLEVVATRS